MAESADVQLNGLVGRVRDVRRWLVALAVSRTAAAGAALFTLFVGAFSMLDHRLHFGPLPRLAALALLVLAFGAVAWWLVRELARHFTVRQAARYVERHRSYDQQLVTAIEYYEDRDDYPYSKALAEHLVRQVDSASRGADFTEAVPKWQAYAAAAVIAIGAIVVGIALYSNAVYFTRYFARLVQPLSDISPVPATVLETITGDIVTPPDVNVNLAARVDGQVPEQATLRVVAGDTDGAEEKAVREILLSPSEGGKDGAQFSTLAAFPTGAYRYRFQAGDAVTGWNRITVAEPPRITAIEAEVSARAGGAAYSETVEEYTLDVLEGAGVTLTVETSEPVKDVTVQGLDGEQHIIESGAGASFQYQFTAAEAGMVRFAMAGETGLVNDRTPPLQVLVHGDAAPEFKLIAPGGDYLATNVASIPIQVEVTDDFGLASAELVIELPGRAPIRIGGPLKAGARSAVLAHTLELEDYDLVLGDAIVYHAEAADVGTGIKEQGETAAGDLYFIEIKPYRQIWHQPPPSMPSDFGKPGLSGEFETHAKLLAVLEYARAMLKKTWPLARDPNLDEREQAQLLSLRKDAVHIQKQARLIKEDPSYQFSEEQLAMLEDVQDEFGAAGDQLAKQDPAGAIPPEKEGYRNLRQLVLELEKALTFGGGSPPPPGPERLEMEEQVHLTRFEKEQQDWDMERLAKSLDQIREQQNKLRERFDRFMKDFGRQESFKQATTGETSWAEAAKTEASGEDKSSEEGEGGNSNVSVEGALPQVPGGSGSGPPSPKTPETTPASFQDRLAMMQAQESALRQQAETLAEALSGQPDPSEDAQTAMEHLKRALENMAAFESAAAEAQYTGSKEALDRAAQAMSDSMRQLDLARFAMDLAARLSEQELASRQLMAQAEAMAQIAQALEETADPAQRAELMAQLDQAMQQLGESGGAQYVRPFSGAGTPPNYTALVRSLVPDADKSNLDTGWQDREPAREARWIAEQLWSRALDAQKQAGDLRRDDPSDPAFAPFEQKFFEKAAEFEPEAAP